MRETLRVLQVEDSESDAELIVRVLEKAGYEVRTEQVNDADGMRAALADKIWDVVIADYHLPRFDAPAALAVLHEKGLDLPFLVVSGAMGEDLAVALMKAGAHDYLNKDSLARLAPAVEREIREAQVRQERRRAEESLRLALIATKEANHRYHLVADHGRTIIWEMDAEGLYTYVSHVSEAVVGYRPEELIGKKHFYDIHSDEEADAFRPAMLELFSRERPFLNLEKPVRAKDGRKVWVSSNGIPVLNDRGELAGYRGSSTDITERKRAEEEGQLSEQRYRSLFEHMLDAFAYWRVLYDDRNRPMDFVYLEVNQRFEQITGLQDVVGKRISEIMFGGPRPDAKLLKIFSRVALSGKTERFDVYCEQIGRWLSITVYSPRQEYIVAVFDDITEQKRHEADREMTVALLRLLNSQTDERELIRSVISLLQEWSRCDTVNIRLKDGEELAASTAGSPVTIPIRNAGQTLGFLEFNDPHPDRFTPEAIAQMERAAASLAIALEQRRAQAALRASEERYRLISENTADVIWLMDANTCRYTYVSPSVQRMFGYSPEEIRGKEMGFVLTEESHRYASRNLPEVLERFANGDESVRTQVHQIDQVRKDGTIVQTEVVTTLLRNPQGRAGEILGVTRDITERVLVEAQLMQAQKLESVGRLAGGVAHDFNNLLTVINGYSDMILTDLPSGEALQELASEIRTAGERAAALSGQLLVLSRKQMVQAKEVNLNDIICEVEKMLGRVIGEDIHLESILSPALGRVLADPGQLHQILMNLAVNARDAMPGGGKLLIETTNIDISGGFAEQDGEVPAGHYALLSVSDTGVGMTKEVMSHLFEPFFTTKKAGEGTGLGLATVYGIVKQCGGAIRVCSEPGHGTIFRIYLPRIASVEQAQNEPAGQPSPARGTETVLVVEDQDQLRKIVVRVLQGRGYKALGAAGPQEALALSASYAGPIHLLLTDVVMPGMTGPELASRLKPLRPSMEVIFMSGYSERALLDRQLMESAGRYLPKPFSPEALAIRVRDVLSSSRRAETIVVADDEAGIRSLLSKILTDAGYQVLEAKNGREAVRQVEASGAALMITDLAMPEQEGIETIQKLHRIRPKLKIIAISGRFAGTLLQATERLGAQATISKPIHADELLQVVASVMFG
jgi:PAS domain S-box-containing protein